MSIEIEIGIYSDDDKKNAIPQKNKFESVQELRAYLDFAKEGYNTDPLLLVQLGEGKQPFLLDKDSNFALNEFIKEVYNHYKKQQAMENKLKIEEEIQKIQKELIEYKNLVIEGAEMKVLSETKTTTVDEKLSDLYEKWEKSIGMDMEDFYELYDIDVLNEIDAAQQTYGLENHAKVLLNKKFTDIENVLEMAESNYTSKETLDVLAYHENKEVKAEVAENKNTPAKTLNYLAYNRNREVKEKVAENKNTPAETLSYLAHDDSNMIKYKVKHKVAENKNTPAETLSYLADDDSFIVKQKVAQNENTPIEALTKLAKDSHPDVREKAIEKIELINQKSNRTPERLIKIGESFHFKDDNKEYEVYNIRGGQPDPKIYLESYDDGIRTEEFLYQSDIMRLLDEKKIVSINQKSNTMEQAAEQQEQKKEFNQVDYLKNQMKYLGFGESEKLQQDLVKGINSREQTFEINTTSDRVMAGNKAEFNLQFNKTDRGGVFLNSYEAKLTTSRGEERSHTFRVQKENSITAKEAVNLLEGRAVKIDWETKNKETGEISKDPAFIKLKLKEEKSQYGNYKLEVYNKNYGVNVDDIMNKSNLSFADGTEYDRTKKHLEKGNITNVNFVHDKKEIQGFAVLNPQWKMLNLYDENMSRVNSNKAAQTTDLQNNEKNNVREQSHSRSM